MLSSTVDRSTDRKWLVEVYVTLKPAVNDPQGLAIRDGLHMLGFHEVGDVRAGKYMQLEVSASDRETAESRVTEMCQKLLANTVIESYRFDVSESDSQSS